MTLLWEEMATVGRVARPQGNRGEVVVASSTDFPGERFRPGAVVWVRREGRVGDLTVTTSREHDGRWIVGLTGVNTIGDAESLRGLELRIPAEQLRPLEPGSHYVHDLVGCRVETTAGRPAGSVQDVRLEAGVPLLVIEGTDGEILIPFTDAICRRVDVPAKLIVIAPPEGLLDLNERRT